MLLWAILFTSFLAIFISAALVWHRLERAKRNQNLKEKLLAGVETPQPAIKATSTLVKTPTRGRLRFFQSADPTGQSTGNGWSPAGFLALTCVMILAGLLVGVKMSELIGPSALLIGMAAFGMMPFMYRKKQRNRRLLAIEEQFPDALDFLSRSVRAGNAFSVGLELLTAEASEPLKAEVLKVTRELVLGSSLDVALNGLVARAPLLEVRFFVSAVLLQRETGGNLSEVLGKLSASVRERLRLRGHVKAASGQGRLTAMVLTILPIATMIILRMASPDYMKSLTEDPLGRDMLAAAVVSQIMGYLVMQKIIRIEV
jgi:tight adherence protein B